MNTAHQRPDRLWDAALGELQMQVARPAFETWLKDTQGLAYADGVFSVGAPNAFISEMLEQRMYPLIERALERVCGEAVSVQFRVAIPGDDAAQPDDHSAAQSVDTPHADEHASSHTAQPPARNMPPTRSAAALNARYTFDRFIVGKSNELAHAAAQAVADKPGLIYNPLVLYSDVGLGKTHLLHAIGQQALAKRMSLIYATTEEFTNEYISAIREGKTEDFRLRYRSADLLLLDDIQFLIGKEQTQEGFFHTFNALHMSNRQIVITSDRPVTALKVLEDRISSRLSGGLVADIQPPDLETRLAILRAKAEHLRIAVSPDVLELLGARIFRNIRELEGSLNRVAAYAQLTGRPLDADLVRQVAADAQDAVEQRQPSEREALDAVSAHYGVDIDALRGVKRDKKTALARQVAMYILQEDAHLNSAAIARALDKKHPTVLHGCKTIKSRQNVDDKLRRDILSIRESLAQG